MPQVIFQPSESAVAAAKDAIAIQDACNGMAVMNTTYQHMTALRKNAEYVDEDGKVRGLDTDTLSQHPAIVLLVSKLASLAAYGIHDHDAYRNAFAACSLLQDGKASEPYQVIRW